MANALKRAWSISRRVGSIAVVTDPKDAKAAEFYIEFNFRQLKPGRLFLPMKEIEGLLASRKNKSNV